VPQDSGALSFEACLRRRVIGSAPCCWPSSWSPWSSSPCSPPSRP